MKTGNYDNVTVKCDNATVPCHNVTGKYNNVTVPYHSVMGKYDNVRGKCHNVTVLYYNVMGKCDKVTLPYRISPLHCSISPLHYSNSPLHCSISPLHYSNSPLHYSISPFHYCNSPLHYPISPLHYPISPLIGLRDDGSCEKKTKILVILGVSSRALAAKTKRRDRLKQEKRLLRELEKAAANQEKKVAEAMKITRDRKETIKQLDQWMAEFFTILRLAPGKTRWLEAAGLKVK